MVNSPVIAYAMQTCSKMSRSQRNNHRNYNSNQQNTRIAILSLQGRYQINLFEAN